MKCRQVLIILQQNLKSKLTVGAGLVPAQKRSKTKM